MGKVRGKEAREASTQVLHAPWRIEFIRAPKPSGCFFCRAAVLARGDEKGWKEHLLLHKNPQAMVIMNRFPYNGGHLLIAPLQHTADLAGLSPEESAGLWEFSRLCLPILQAKMNPQGFNLGMNLGKPAGAGVEDHLHMHVVPRWTGDSNFLPVIGATRQLPVALEELWEELREAFRDGKAG